MSRNGSGGQSRELVRLATIDRKNGQEEFRLSVDEFQPNDGKRPSRYTSLRVWWQGRDGDWLPGKAGITIRRNEITEVIAALQKAERIFAGKEQPQHRDEHASDIEQEDLGF